MNSSTAVFLINDRVRALLALYEPNGGKCLFKTFDQSIKVDDILVVPAGTRHGFTTVKVTDVDVEFDIDTAQPVWVVNKVDMSAYDGVLAQEGEAISMIRSAETRKKREALKEALFADQAEKINALPIAHVAQDSALPKS